MHQRVTAIVGLGINMKKIITILIALLFTLPAIAEDQCFDENALAWMNTTIISGSVASGTEEYLDYECDINDTLDAITTYAKGGAFTAPNSGELTGLGVLIGYVAGDGTITVRVGTSSDLTSNYSEATLTTNGTGWQKVTFSSPLSVTASTEYYWGLIRGTANNPRTYYNTTNPCANGYRCVASSGWNLDDCSSSNSYDEAVRIYVTR